MKAAQLKKSTTTSNAGQELTGLVIINNSHTHVRPNMIVFFLSCPCLIMHFHLCRRDYDNGNRISFTWQSYNTHSHLYRETSSFLCKNSLTILYLSHQVYSVIGVNPEDRKEVGWVQVFLCQFLLLILVLKSVLRISLEAEVVQVICKDSK